MNETLRALEERAKEYRKDPVDIAMLKASRERLEEYKKDREAQRAFNARVVPSTLARFKVGADSINALRKRVAWICANPITEPHTIWNAQNFLEQVEAAMEEKE